MLFVSFLVDGEVGEAFWLVDAVKLFQAIDFGGGNFGNLRFIGIESRNGLRDRTLADNLAKSFDHGLRAGKGRAGGYIPFADAESGGEIAPELRVRGGRVFLFGQILKNDFTQRTFGAAASTRRCLGNAST